MPVPMELSRIIISEINDQQVIYLKEIGGGQRTFPILIGIFEATSIDRRVKGYRLAAAADPRFGGQRGGEPGGPVAGRGDQRTERAHLFRPPEGPPGTANSWRSTPGPPTPSPSPLPATRRLPIYVSEDVLNDVLGE